MLSNEPLEGIVALSLPFSCMQQPFISFDLGLPFVLASILAGQGKRSASEPSLLHEMLHDRSPLNIHSSDDTANGVVKPNKIGGFDQSSTNRIWDFAPNTKDGVAIDAPAAALGFGSGILPAGRRKLAVIYSMVFLSNSAKSTTEVMPSS
jgi:hypothetical protein